MDLEKDLFGDYEDGDEEKEDHGENGGGTRPSPSRSSSSSSSSSAASSSRTSSRASSSGGSVNSGEEEEGDEAEGQSSLHDLNAGSGYVGEEDARDLFGSDNEDYVNTPAVSPFVVPGTLSETLSRKCVAFQEVNADDLAALLCS